MGAVFKEHPDRRVVDRLHTEHLFGEGPPAMCRSTKGLTVAPMGSVTIPSRISTVPLAPPTHSIARTQSPPHPS
jgi:hypothetical protein